MRRCILVVRFGLLALTGLAACSTGSNPTEHDMPEAQGVCVTDLSCPFGQECAGSACAPIPAGLYPHIQTASALLRGPLDAEETAWRATHYDLMIGGVRPDDARAFNPNARLFDYTVTRYHLFDRGVKTAHDWAIAHGYDPEDFYLHYREDVYPLTWQGRVIVPGYPPGMVPGWNPGGGGPPASATQRSHSRVVGFYNGSTEPWYMGSVANAGYRQFLVERMEGLIDGTWYSGQPFATGPLDGVMCDESIYYPLFGEGHLDRTAEYYGIPVTEEHPYAIAVENLYPYCAVGLHAAFGDTKDVMPNYGHVFFLNYPNRSAVAVQATTPWIWGEVWVTYTGLSYPTSGNSRCITYEKDYVNAVREIVDQTRARGRRVLGARDPAYGAAGSDRGRILTLALYYLVHNRHTYYMYETVSGHALPDHVSNWAWNPAVEYDVGQPDVVPEGMVDFEGRANTKEHYVLATGPDPYLPSLTYRVLARRFTNALVLVKLLPQGSVVDSRSLTTHPLDGPYAPLKADGTLDTPVSEAQLRNNEALILIPSPATGVR
jgi:hypothetical protein